MDPRIPTTIDEKGESSHVPSPTTPHTPPGDHSVVTQPPSNQPVRPPQPPQHPIVPTFFGELAGTDGQAYRSLRKRVTDAYRWHTFQYWFVAVTSNSLLFLQILIAASLTVLGAFNDRRARTATIFLGATNTVIAGLITYFKSRNQPNRARQFRNDLAKVVDQFDDAEANFRNPECHDDVYTVMEQIRQAYNQARTDSEINYPDLWVRGSTPDNKNPTPRTSTNPPTQTPAPPPAAHAPPPGTTTTPRPASDVASRRPISDSSTIRAV
ncbi:uncharacterized protein Z520_04438 [Fonsecaea multimorphosa CBS 102226]|uniref:SMODS and SLOG-associating 2TM effector domain-containing protein n=1 Tax=Fonsecaea multimorphosa CBS 102226 TaxID=1442371 RepID=A0A0D2K1R3_9EURO|nr:uncharacterized protein Z520_04438 [Fonsecaea multimorphosa CBS 102226]KIX99802.1 hypothetical protein Z520_04438 [Fonsecaea multimorphosa CBS 102226]OAL26525.1 hypothetical protein AYO22_04200 [Fonsecaea multimorphosa]